MSSNFENFKTKRNILSVEQRCNIIQRLKDGESPQSLADEYKISKQAISWIKKNETSIIQTQEVLKSCSGNINKKRYKKQEENILDQKLMKWLSQQRSMGRTVSGTTIQKQALLYNKLLNGNENFTASHGWLAKFKKRYGLKNKNAHGEKLSANLEGSEDFKEKFNNFRTITDISLDCIYNCDETGLYWKMMPSRRLVKMKKNKAERFKKPKNRVTVMACTNASGTHKIPLFVIGRSAQPRCLRGIKNVPVHYTNQENSWMTCEIMKTWYTETFLPEIKKKHRIDENPETKIVLIMDNAACHPPAEELNKLCESCTIIFLPPNTTSLMQPLEQGIIEKFKRRYRNDLIEKIVFHEKNNAENNDYFKSFDLLEAFNLCVLAWDEVTSSDIRNCWKNLIPLTADNSAETAPVTLPNNEAFYAIIKRIKEFKMCTPAEVDNWLQIDCHDNGWQPLSDNDILANRCIAENQEKEEELDDEISYNDQNYTFDDSIIDSIIGNCPTFIEAMSGLNTFLRWYQRNGDSQDVLNACQKGNQELIRLVIRK
ncbi:jerky protein homolog-like [Cotesia glomerata]|uniref:jerky protein homolog-like n=1 Tax=Cotesia glomerata TaxID=32391 RepID=UPI001D02C4FF|nr:jerky protein homolog-like [Cotesia glomerata]